MFNLSKATFREYAQKWLDVHCANLSPTTVQGYKKDIYTYADKYTGSSIITKILPIHIQEMLIFDEIWGKLLKNLFKKALTLYRFRDILYVG